MHVVKRQLVYLYIQSNFYTARVTSIWIQIDIVLRAVIADRRNGPRGVPVTTTTTSHPVAVRVRARGYDPADTHSLVIIIESVGYYCCTCTPIRIIFVLYVFCTGIICTLVRTPSDSVIYDFSRVQVATPLSREN